MACVTPKDTFPPAAPKNLQGVQAEGVVNLIWDPNQEKDLAGYIVLRAVGSEELTPVTPEPISGQQFTSPVPSGARVVFAVRAVDKVGNLSPLSNRFEETAR